MFNSVFDKLKNNTSNNLYEQPIYTLSGHHLYTSYNITYHLDPSAKIYVNMIIMITQYFLQIGCLFKSIKILVNHKLKSM